MPSEKLEHLNKQTAVVLSAAISPALHPDTVSDHGAVLVDLEHSGTSIDAYGAARAALKALYTSASQIDEAVKSLSKPLPIVGAQFAKGSTPILKMQIPPEREPELASAMANSASRAMANVERNADVVDRSLAKLNDFIKSKTTNPRANEAATAAESAQIREYVRGLNDPSKQSSFLQQAVDAGDFAVATAVLGASPFASGISREAHAILRQFAEAKFAPSEVRQRAALIDIQKKMNVAMSSYTDFYSKKLPKPRADDASVASLAALKGAA